MFSFPEKELSSIRIKVIGVGGGGCNAVNTMITAGLNRVEFIVANTDVQALNKSSSPFKIQLGPERTHGLGAGADPDVGKAAALESEGQLREALEGAEMVFVTAGMGGGTGTGGAPITARIARELGILTVGVVTKPFAYEGNRRSKFADEGIQELKKEVNSLLIIPNQKLLGLVDRNTPLVDAFQIADDILRQAIQGISDVIMTPGFVNVDFADVRTIMSYAGRAVMGMGIGRGPNRASEAAKLAISSPLLEDGSIEGAKGLLLNITGGPNLTLHEVDEASSIAKDAADPQANIIVGQVIEPNMADEVVVTVIATGFEHQEPAGRTSRVQSQNGRVRAVAAVAVAAGGNVFGTKEHDLDRPTFIRRYEPQPQHEGPGSLLLDQDWDVPTFMRKQAE